MESREEKLAAIRQMVSMIIGLLEDGEYETIESLTSGRHLSAQELREAVQDYPGAIVSTPLQELEAIDVSDVERQRSKVPPFKLERRSYAVVAPIWTVEEGESDLMLELTIREMGNGFFEAQIDNLHVM